MGLRHVVRWLTSRPWNRQDEYISIWYMHPLNLLQIPIYLCSGQTETDAKWNSAPADRSKFSWEKGRVRQRDRYWWCPGGNDLRLEATLYKSQPKWAIPSDPVQNILQFRDSELSILHNLFHKYAGLWPGFKKDTFTACNFENSQTFLSSHHLLSPITRLKITCLAEE